MKEEMAKFEAKQPVIPKGIIMTDGLLHAADGRVYFPDTGKEVEGVNVNQYWSSGGKP